MDIEIREAYEALWTNPPQFLSERDIFEKKLMMARRRTGLESLGIYSGISGNIRLSGEVDEIPPLGLEQLNRTMVQKQSRAQNNYNFEVCGQKLRLATISCLLFTDKNPLRHFFVTLVFWKYTNAIIYSMILLNSLFLGLYDFTKSESETTMNQVCNFVLLFFGIIFLLEAAIKIIAMGVAFSDKTYLRDYWNIVDGLVCVSIIATFNFSSFSFPPETNFTIFRLLRLLQLLQTLRISETLTFIVSTLLKSLMQIIFVLLLIILIILMMAVIGMSSFGGLTHFFCRSTSSPVDGLWPVSESDTQQCGGYHSCDENTFCGSLYDYSGTHDPSHISLNSGVTHFDNIGNALVSIAQCTFVDGWTRSMFAFGDAFSLIYSSLFFVFCLLLCGYFSICLILPVLQDYYFNYILYFKNPSINNQKSKVQKKLTSLYRDPVSESPIKKQYITLKSIRKSIIDSFSFSGENSSRIAGVNCHEQLILLMEAPIFNTFMAIFIIACNIIQATETSNYSNEILLSTSYFALLGISVCETALRIIANSSYLNEPENICDILVILGASLECLIPMKRGRLLALRMFKIFLYFQISPQSKHSVRVIGKALQALGLLSVIVLIFLYVFAVLGMEFFAGKLDFSKLTYLSTEDSLEVRGNFDSIFWALFTCFQGFMGDNFFLFVYLAVTQVGWKYAIYFYALMLAGNVIMFSMLYSILLSIFKENKVSIESHPSQLKISLTIFANNWKAKERMFKMPEKIALPSKDDCDFKRLKALPKEQKEPVLEPIPEPEPESDPEVKEERSDTERSNNEAKPLGTEARLEEINTARVQEEEISQSQIESSEEEEEESCIWTYMQNHSLLIFDKNWKIIKWISEWVIPYDSNPGCGDDVEIVDAVYESDKISNERKSFKGKIVNDYRESRKNKSSIFETVILVLIILSIVILILDDPLADPDSTLKETCYICHLVFTILFSIEAFLKIVSMGFIWPFTPEEPSYLSVGWNVLDFCVVVFSIIYVSNLTILDVLRSFIALRALRLLRPMRSIKNNEQLKLLVTAFITVLPNILILIFFLAVYLFSISLITTFYFKGRLYTCSLDNHLDTKADCENAGGIWEVYKEGFDNVGLGMLLLGQIVFKEGWIKLAYKMIDDKGQDLYPEKNYNPFWGIFIAIFTVIGYLLVTGMFLCVLFECFYTAKLEFCGALSCSLNEQQWINIQRFMVRRDLKLQMSIPTNCIRNKCYEIAKTCLFKSFDIFFNILGIALLCGQYYNMNNIADLSINICVYICILQLNLFCVIKLMAFGKVYIKSNISRWEIFVCFLCDLGFFMQIGLDEGRIVMVTGTVLRLTLIIDSLKVIPSTKLAVIADSIAFIFPSLVNVFIMVLLLVFIFAILGVDLFWRVKFQGSINERNNFRNLWHALLLIFTTATGENWTEIMQSLVYVEGKCYSSQSYQDIQEQGVMGCGTYTAYPFFFILIVALHLIGMKLFAIVVIEGYMEAVNENYSIITASEFEDFLDKWKFYDPSGSGWISFDDFIYLFFSLDPPLGIYTQSNRRNLWEKFIDTNRRNKKIILRSTLKRRLISQIDLNEDFMMHKYESCVINRIKILQFLKQMKIPLEIDTWRVHFRDVCQRMAVRAIRNAKREKFNIKTSAAVNFFVQKWLIKFPEKRKRKTREIYAKEYWIANLTYRILKQLVAKRKEQKDRKATLSVDPHHSKI